MPFCTECGKSVEIGDNFCPWCGTVVSKAPKSEKAERAPEASDEVRPLNDYGKLGKVSSTTRVAPIYGSGYREGIHCWNCGSKPGSGKKCQTCLVEI